MEAGLFLCYYFIAPDRTADNAALPEQLLYRSAQYASERIIYEANYSDSLLQRGRNTYGST